MLFSTANYFEADQLLRFYPVGKVYCSVDPTNPSLLFGGTWVSIAAGRCLVGVDTGDADFNTPEKLFGTKTHTLQTTEIPAHSHGVTDPGHNHTQNSFAPRIINSGTAGTVGVQGASAASNANASNAATTATNQANTTGISINNTGGGTAHNNVQPSLCVYFWKRTA